MILNRLPILLAFLLIVACSKSAVQDESAGTQVSIQTIENNIRILSSDDFQGRKPFTEGEEKTVNFLVDQLKSYGLAPGNGNSFTQQVNLVELNATPDEEMKFSTTSGTVTLKKGTDFVAYTEQVTETVSLENSEVVFAGFGVVAPEYNWNDYADLDVKGKTVIVLVNDPGFGSGDSTFFKGDIMTYYGRWTYKYEEAMRQGAAGVLIVHETVPAGYGWAVVENSWSGARLYLDNTTASQEQPKIQGWITRDAAVKLFKASGVDMKNFQTKARVEGFEAIDLKMTASVSLSNTIKQDVSKNVVAKITGSKKPEEYIIYSAHWDHLGIGIPVDGDSIYNGAHDNASGSATLLAIAEAFSKASTKPERTVVFLFVTAEEQGLLGSAFYAANPIYPPQETIANINMDGLAYYGKMKDLTVVGYGQSELDDLAEQIAKKQGRYIMPDPEPGKGYFFRSDHFSFAKVGIPAIFASGSYESMDKGVDFVTSKKTDFLSRAYHKPADEIEDDWSFEGMQQDGQLFLEMGMKLSQADMSINWKAGSEFKSIREKSLRN
ncbi:MAG: M28 family metallopeptidase [Bacteroidota bacterium]